MSENFIRLTCTTAGHAKEYVLSVTGFNQIVANYGRIGKATGKKHYGAFNCDLMIQMLSSKIRKGYEIVEVNGKPFSSGIIRDAVLLLSDAVDNKSDWSQLSTAQPETRLPPTMPAPVVTFDPGQVAPVW